METTARKTSLPRGSTRGSSTASTGTSFVKEGSREMDELKGFDWDGAISHVNGMISKAEAYANS